MIRFGVYLMYFNDLWWSDPDCQLGSGHFHPKKVYKLQPLFAVFWFWIMTTWVDPSNERPPKVTWLHQALCIPFFFLTPWTKTDIWQTYLHLSFQIWGRRAGTLSGDVGSRRQGHGVERHALFVPDLLHLRSLEKTVLNKCKRTECYISVRFVSLAT